jgi:hypothetical protein
VNYPFRELQQARDLLCILRKRALIVKRLDEVLKLPVEENFNEYGNVISQAEENQLDSAALTTAKKRLKNERDRRECLDLLSSACDKQDIGALRAAVERAESIGISNNELAVRAKTSLQRLTEEIRLCDNVERALGHGGWLQEGDVIECDSLQNAHDMLKSFGPCKASTKSLLERAHCLLQLRRQMASAIGSVDREVWKPVEDLVIKITAQKPHNRMQSISNAVRDCQLLYLCERFTSALSA